MGAQLLSSVTEITFTDSEASVIVTFATGRVIELFGDGFVQEIKISDSAGIQVLESQI